MCVIIYSKEGTILSKDVLKKAWERNSDGAGFVACAPGSNEWVFKKGIMTYEELEKELEPYLDPNAALLLHLRIKSKGDINEAMTHPFDYSKKDGEKRYIFHNGTIKLLFGTHGCSDSSELAKLIKPVGNNAVQGILQKLTDDKHGRFVTFVQKDNEKPVINIYPDEESEEKDGIWYSNTRHEKETKAVVVYNSGNQHYYNRQTQTNYSKNNSEERQKLVDKIVDYYILKNKNTDNDFNRNKIIEHYSVNIMCDMFLKQIIEKIDGATQDYKGDPIIEFFDI